MRSSISEYLIASMRKLRIVLHLWRTPLDKDWYGRPVWFVTVRSSSRGADDASSPCVKVARVSVTVDARRGRNESMQCLNCAVERHSFEKFFDWIANYT